MWFLVHVVKGSKYFEEGSPVGNRVLISDTSEISEHLGELAENRTTFHPFRIRKIFESNVSKTRYMEMIEICCRYSSLVREELPFSMVMNLFVMELTE